MSLLTLLRRLRGSVRSSGFEQNMDADLRHHLELETELWIARGLTRRRRAAAIDPMRALRAD